MKKGFWRLGGTIVVLLVLAACGGAAYQPAQDYVAAEEPVEVVEIVEIVEVEDEYISVVIVTEATPTPTPTPTPAPTPQPAHYADIFTSGRTRGEYLEDLDHLYNTLAANFPFFGVIYRSMGVDMHAAYHETRLHIETVSDIPSDQHFVNMLDTRFISPVRSAGHFNMLTGSTLQQHIEIFSNQVALGSPQFVYFVAEMDNPATRALHGLTDANFEPPPPGQDSFAHATTSRNITTRIIEPGRIAYVNILGMSHATMHLDRYTLQDFFASVTDFDHLIIDIRQNSGGDSRFFPRLVIAPNISDPLEYHFYMFLMAGDHNMRLLAPWFHIWWTGDEYPVFHPIHDDLLARLPYLNATDAAALDLYWQYRGIIQPAHDEALFNGKIWLLVSQTNFSAAEQAAAISKQTGFATLVGQTTRGDGVGINPVVLALPNSGIVVRYSPVYGTDPYGRNNQEFGTNPHIFNRPGRDALQTVLELIGEGDW